MALLTIAAVGVASLIGTKMVTKTVKNVKAEKNKANVEIADIQQKTEMEKNKLEYDKKKLDMNKNVLDSNFQYSIKCVSCHAVLTGYPYKSIRCEYCDTVQSISDDSIII